jgi:transposase
MDNEYKKKYIDIEDKIIGIDLGLRILFTTSSSHNQYYGKDIIDYLYKSAEIKK